MPKKISISIKESIKFLNNSYSKAKGRLQQDRIKTLLYVKSEKYAYQSSIGKKLGRTEKTIREWLKTYSEKGFSGLLKVSSGGNNKRTLSSKVICLIESKVTDPHSTITSYVELRHILEKETGEKVAYGALYSHCRRKFKTKLKVARKSHYKKDPEAEALFKKVKKTV